MKRMFLCLVIVALCGLLATQHGQAIADGSPFSLVKDINTMPQPTDGVDRSALFATFNNTIVFSGNTPQTGNELWRTDGTDAGTHLIKDIQPGAGSSIGYHTALWQVLGNTLLFTADDGAIGDELWVTDGTAAGTLLLKDLWPGADSGAPQNVTVVGNHAFFTAQIGETQYGLWVTDGTPAGTTLLHAFRYVTSNSTAMGSTLIFSAAGSDGDIELWKSDGTEAGTVLVKDINPGNSASPADLLMLNANLVLFSAYDDTHGRELWRSDGTEAGTVLVKDINPGVLGSSNHIHFTLLSGGVLITEPDRVLFNADDGTHGVELWTTDGTEAGTHLVKDVAPNLLSANPAPLGFAPPAGRRVIGRSRALYAMNDGTHGNELWITDGETTDTLMLADSNPGSANGDPSTVVSAGGILYFTANGGTVGRQLWKTDGTAANTKQVIDIITTGYEDSDPRDLTAFNGKLYFSATDSMHGRELWSSDGTTLTLLKDIWAGQTSSVKKVLGVALGSLYFIANDGVTGQELWKTDGTPDGTVLVKNVAPDTGGIYLSTNYDEAVLGDKLVFGPYLGQELDLLVAQAAMRKSNGRSTADHKPMRDTASARIADDASANALWLSDGTAGGTTPIKPFPGVGYSGQPYGFTTLGNGVLFGELDTSGVQELWRSDGTTAGTTILTNTVKPFFGYISGLTPFNNLAVFDVYTGTMSMHNNDFSSLWKTDGTPQGTQLLRSNVVYNSQNRAVSGNTLFFQGNPKDKSNDHELWKTDGTPAGTVLVKDIVSGDDGSDPQSIAAGQPGEVFFVARTTIGDYQLWKSDGTDAGTVLVHNVRVSNSNDEYGSELVYVNGTLFFAADDGTNGWELWKSDGTDAGTTMVADLYPGAGSSSPMNLIGLNNSLYFSATRPDGKRTLWRSDGTAAGTQPIRTDSGAPLNPEEITVVQGQLMFSATDDAHGREVWHSDGTAAGTTLLQDIVPGPDSSDPEGFIQANQHVYFTADTPGVGRELWATTPIGSPPITGQPTPTPPGQASQRVIYLPLVKRP